LSQLLSEVTFGSCNFIHQMSNVFALLLDDALLKICAVTEVILFSIVAFRQLHFTR